MRRISFWCALALVLLVVPSWTQAQRSAPDAPRADSAPWNTTDRTFLALRATLDSFIVDFNNLDSARFSARWARAASAVLPFADTPHRLDSREAVLARLMRYFARMRTERTGPPYLFMVVQDVGIELLGERSAVVTYEFAAAGAVQRRSLVMVREDDGAWRVAHLHGSAGALAPPTDSTTSDKSPHAVGGQRPRAQRTHASGTSAPGLLVRRCTPVPSAFTT